MIQLNSIRNQLQRVNNGSKEELPSSPVVTPPSTSEKDDGKSDKEADKSKDTNK